MENGKLKRIREALPGEDVLSKRITRRGLLAGAGAGSFALLLAACGGGGSSETTGAAPTTAPPETGAETGQPAISTGGGGEAPLKSGLADGMYGGPTGFPGAERYQYPLDSEEGRAISALRKMVQDGTAPDTLVVQTLNFARPQFETPATEGAPTIVQLFEEETGIKIKFVETDPAQEYQTNLKNASTKNGSFDAVTSAIEEMGDFAEAGLIRPLDEFVQKYQPAWSDPEFGYAGGDPTVTLFTKYKGQTYFVAFDNDTQPFMYRSDLFEDEKEKADFADKYGRELRFPLTWDEHAEVAEFFTRPDANPPLYGDVMTYAPFWCVVNFNQRLVCSGDPNFYYFNEDGSANVNNEAGVRALTEILNNLKYHEPGALTKDWLAQYQLMGSGNGVMGGSFPNSTKIIPGNKDLDKANVGQYLKTDVTPGRVVNGKLVRRPVIFYNISYGVNAFADSARHEATYLFLQWAGSARVYTLLCFNPNGYQDPHHTFTMEDPYTAQSYKPEPLGAFKEIVPRTAPPITIRGGSEYRQAVSDVMQKVLTKQTSPEAGAKEIADAWDKTTERLGVDNQVEALKTLVQAFPTVTDTPDQELDIQPVDTTVA
jgi:multiple sugar transport system substrate-binding protein